MEPHIETIARYIGQIIAILDLMNEQYPEFKSIISFKIIINEEEEINGAGVGLAVEGGDLTDLLINISETCAKNGGEALDFEIELNVMLNKLQQGLKDNGEEG